MRCPQCGHENPEGQRFCGDCGNAISATCGTCGSLNAPGQRFCGSCGASLAPAAETGQDGSQAEQAIQTTTERRLVSVLFADLVGFTTLSETRDPEEVRELLTRYFEESRRVVDRYGGVDREVHRRRRDGALGLPGRARGRRRAGRPRRPGAHGPGQGHGRRRRRARSARAGRGPDGGGRGHARGGGSGHGGGRSRQHRVADPVGRAGRLGLRGGVDDAHDRRGDLVRTRGHVRAQGQGDRDRALAGRPGRRSPGARQDDRDRAALHRP